MVLDALKCVVRLVLKNPTLPPENAADFSFCDCWTVFNVFTQLCINICGFEIDLRPVLNCIVTDAFH